MPNLAKEKTPMQLLGAGERAKSFSEVALGYTEGEAMNEAARCLGCKNKPCVAGCPVGIDIPAFIAETAAGNFESAYDIISAASSLPAVCGRVCPQETQCEGVCVRANSGESVAIGRLERFVADRHAENVGTQDKMKPAADAQRVAIIGSGPAGLSCAGELARAGFSVTVFEALHTAGGVLVYGIPEFRLPKAIVQREIENLKDLGVEIATNTVIGKTVLVDELFEEGFSAVFIGSGAGLPRFMGIEGETLNGVYSANEFLTRVNLMKAYLPSSQTPLPKLNKVAVVGGGNVAMDAARAAVRLGAQEVQIIYRRSENELPARREEVEHAKEEGVIFRTLCNPVAILGEGHTANKIRCIEMQLGAPDESGRRRPSEKPGSEFELETDCVIMAIGTSPNPLIKATTRGIETTKWGGIITEDETGATTREGVFAGGDAVTGAATVISAMGAGKRAAKAIMQYLDS